ncbi:MAG: hypothetical protein WKG32_11365 [Gemmatimonadaceae bacterium]
MPDSPPPSNLPATRSLERAALERVIARAAELQALDADTGDGALTEAQIVDVGKEAGLSPQHIRQALAEERSRLAIPDDPGFVGRVAGPAIATATRTVHGAPADVLATLDGWMQREECLQPKRRFADRGTWEARRDFAGSIQRSLNIGGRGYALARAAEVGATVVPVDEGRVLVRLDADLGPSRTSRVAAGGATAATGLIAGSAPLVIGSMVMGDPTSLFYAVAGAAAAIGTAVGLGGGYGIARGHQQVIARAQLALEQILDRLERGDPSVPRSTLPSVLGAAAERILKTTMGDIQSKGSWPRLRP